MILLPGLAAAFDYEVFTQNGKQGLRDNSGIVVIPANFDALGWSYSKSEVRNNRIGFLKDGKWGVVSIKNEILYPAELEGLFDATANYIVAGVKSGDGRFKKGLIDYQGKLLVPYIYSSLNIHNTRIIAMVDNKSGMLNLEGKVILPFYYDHIRQVDDLRWFVVDESGLGALFDSSGNRLTPQLLDDIEAYEEGVAIVHIDHFRGLINNEGQWILQPKYSKITINEGNATAIPYPEFIFHKGKTEYKLAADSLKVHSGDVFQLYAAGQTWLIDSDNEVIFPRHEKIEYHKNYLIVSHKGATGLYDISGKNWLLQPLNKNISLAGENLAIVQRRKSGEYSIYTLPSGKQLFSGIQDFKDSPEGLFIKKNGAWGFLSTAGREILSPVYEDIKRSRGGVFIVTFHGDHGIIDSNENWLLLPQEHNIIDFNENIYISYKDSLYNMYNYNGDRLYFSPHELTIRNGYIAEERSPRSFYRIDFDGLSIKSAFKRANYEEVFPISEGLIGIVHNGKYGFVDPEGRLRISNRYEGIQPFKNGFASVKLNGKWGVINQREQLVVQPSYDSIGFFESDKAVAQKEDQFGIIDASGNIVLGIEYDSLVNLNADYYLLHKNKDVGVAEKSGRAILWPKYDAIKLSNGYFIVERNNASGIYNLKGVAIVPPSHEIVIPVPGDNNFIIGRTEENVVVPVK